MIAWGLFIWPAEKLMAASTSPDPFDRLFSSPALAWTARIGLTLCLVAGLQLVVTCVEFFLMPECDMSTRHSFMAPVYRTMCLPWMEKVSSGIWIVLALAASSRGLPTVAASVRFFNQAALFVLVGALLLFRRALSTMPGGPFYWIGSQLRPLVFYFSAAGLAAGVLIAMWKQPAKRFSCRATVMPVAVTVAAGSLVPTSFARAISLSGNGFTGRIDFAHAIWFSYRWGPVLAGKGLLLVLACFAWAQVVFLVFRGIWGVRLCHMSIGVAVFALPGWRPWLLPHYSNWAGNMEAAVATATFLSALAGITAGRAVLTALMKSRTLGNLTQAELIEAAAGGIVAICAILWPNTALDLAPFGTSFVLMVSVAAIQSGPRGSLGPSME